MSEILVVGSMGYDTISTPIGKAENILGGSANYFSIVASLYTSIRIVGVVGDDYKKEDYELLKSRAIDVKGLQQIPGRTFHWEGKYEGDMNEAITLDTQLNVFENFDPVLPEEYKNSQFVFLANIAPELQLKVLDQVKSPKFVASDTMNFWIQSKKSELEKVLKKVDLLLINEKEAQQLTDKTNMVQAAKKIVSMGPRGVVIKRGEYGFVLYAEDKFFILPAFPVESVIDPTGAGDTFAGGFFGYLAKMNSNWNLNHIKQACVHGCILASFTVEGFGLSALKELDWKTLEERITKYHEIIRL